MIQTTCYDTHSCLRCYSCMVNCAVENRARLQRDKGVDVARSINEQLPHLSYLTPQQHQVGSYPQAKTITEFKHCHHCEKPKCMEMCPTGAITKTGSGSVVINEKSCVGCRACADGCPYDVPVFSADTGKSHKCTQCNDRVASGMVPACVEACASNAMFFGKRDEVLAEAQARAKRYSDTTGVNYVVYGGDTINSYVGKTNWLTIAPEKDRDEYGLPIDPQKTSYMVRSLAKQSGGALALVALAGAVGHFSYWLSSRKALLDEEKEKNNG